MERWNLEIHFRKGIHWICFIAGKYSVWYNHGSLTGVCGVERILYGKEYKG